MARPLRLHFPGAVYHLTSRGNRQEHIYHSDEDRKIFIAILGKIVKRYNWVEIAELLPEAIHRSKPQRNDAIVTAHLEHGYTLKEIADEIGIHYTTVSKVLSRYDEI